MEEAPPDEVEVAEEEDEEGEKEKGQEVRIKPSR